MTTQLESSLAAATLHHPKVDLSKADAALPPVTFPVRFTQLFINGQWVDSASKQLLDVINPHTGNVIARVSEADAADVDEAVKAARHAFESTWRHVSPGQRADLMFKLADLMEQHIDELASLESLDNGKSFTVARGVDVTACISTIRYFAGWATKIHGKTIEPEGHYQVLTRHEPFGVVGAIVPWNFPLLMAVWKLGPCLSTGNTMVLKSSEKTPLSVLLLAELTRLAGFPPGVFNVLSGYGHTVGQALAMHMDVDKVAFTGSTATGRKIVRASADSNLKKVTVELGGKSPAIVFPDVNLDEAVEGAHFGLFFNHGQVCCAGSRVFVHESVYDEFVKRSVARAQKLKLAAHVNAAGSQGPQVDDIQQKKILEYIDLGKKEGASLMCGGGTGSSEGFYIEPTVFADVSDSMTIAKEEIFGPVMSILKFSTIDEVITRANQTTFGLAASVWTNDINKATFVANNLRSGSVWINCHNVLQPCIPFGGYKQSGFGRDLGEYALHEYTQVKAIVTKCASKVEELKINMYQ